MKTWAKLAIGLAVMTLLAPLGMLADGTAWGEWITVRGWQAHLAGYSVPGWETSGGQVAGYLLSAIVGTAVILLLAWGVGRLLTKEKRDASWQGSFIERTLAGIETLFRALQTSERFAAKPGLLQKIDPRLKLIAFVLAIVGVTLTHRFPVLIASYAVTLVLAAGSRLPLGALLLRTWLFVPLFTAVMVLPIAVTRPGLSVAGLLILRAATAVSWTLLLLWTTRWNALLGALQAARVPAALVFTLAMTLRYLLLFLRQIEETHWALMSRVPAALPRRQGRKVVAAVVAVLLRKSLEGSEAIYQAMVSRGFSGRIVPLDGRRIR